MNKVDLAKTLGLELYSPNSDAGLQDSLNDPSCYRDIIFEFNEKFFTIENFQRDFNTVNEVWEEAADKIISRVNNFITMEGFREDAY